MRAKFVVPRKYAQIKLTKKQESDIQKSQNEQAIRIQESIVEDINKSSIETTDGETTVKKRPEIKNLFTGFLDNNFDRIDAMVKQAREVQKKKAQERVAHQEEEDKNIIRIKGARDNVFLIKRVRSPGFKERHQKLLREALVKADQDKKEEPQRLQEQIELEE